MPIRFILAKILVLACGAILPAPVIPASTMISGRMKRGEHSSAVNFFLALNVWYCGVFRVRVSRFQGDAAAVSAGGATWSRCGSVGRQVDAPPRALAMFCPSPPGNRATPPAPVSSLRLLPDTGDVIGSV